MLERLFTKCRGYSADHGHVLRQYRVDVCGACVCMRVYVHSSHVFSLRFLLASTESVVHRENKIMLFVGF